MICHSFLFAREENRAGGRNKTRREEDKFDYNLRSSGKITHTTSTHVRTLHLKILSDIKEPA